MASETKFAGTGADDATVGTVSWNNPGNVTAEDGVTADCATQNSAQTHYLKATNFGFAIPAGATITGVKAEFKTKCTVSFGSPIMTISIKLVKGGTISGTDKADSVAWNSSTLTWMAIGSASEMWGLALTPADCNASNFGFVLSAKEFPFNSSSTNYIDAMKLTVYYSSLSPLTQSFIIAP